ncbi:MAG: nucleotide sugar dehydrogenase [Bryobacteraceae bacterium]
MKLPAPDAIQSHSIAVVGLGYVGCVTAACLAHLGHRVCGVEIDRAKVRQVLAGESPFYEPKLTDLIRQGVRSGRLRATVSLEECLREADFCIISVGTPLDDDGLPVLEPLRRLVIASAKTLAQRVREARRPPVIIVRTTILPGTCESVLKPLLEPHGLSLVFNPEFLREGCAVDDFFAPGLIVLGGDDSEAMARVAELYAALPCQPCSLGYRAAEMVKYACNAFHATKIAFANEIGSLCGALGIDGSDVMSVLCQDTHLNLSSAYLRPGFAFGGSCLRKDVGSLVAQANGREVDLPLLGSILPSNRSHLNRAVHAALALPDERIGLYGLSFKEHTDDMRHSPALLLLRELLDAKRSVRVYDPSVRIDRIVGTNRGLLYSVVPEIDGLLTENLSELLRQSSRLILTKRPSVAELEEIRLSELPVLVLTARPEGHSASGSP